MGRLPRQLDQVERELERLTRAIALGGGEVSVLVAALREKNQQLRGLQDRIQALKDSSRRFDPRAVMEDLNDRLNEWQAVLCEQPVEARGLLRQLIVGRLPLVADEERRGYRFVGTGTLVPILPA